MYHTHGPNCGCKEYMDVYYSNDLLGVIDIDKVNCLNEKVTNSCRKLFKDFDNRYDKSFITASYSDGELLLIVPFISQVKIRAICVIAKNYTTHPTKMRLFVNMYNIDFSILYQPCLQYFPLNANLTGYIYHTVNANKFSRVYKLVIHLSNPNLYYIAISYVQIKGYNTNIKRKAVQTVYEIQPAAEKKDLKDITKNRFDIA